MSSHIPTSSQLSFHASDQTTQEEAEGEIDERWFQIKFFFKLEIKYGWLDQI